MDQHRKLRRVSFSDVAQERPEEYSSTRRSNSSVAKSKSFRDEGDAKLRKEYNGKESEFAASLAAAAYAIYSLEETRAEFERRMVESFREDPSAQTNNNDKDIHDQVNTSEFPVLVGTRFRRSSSFRVENQDNNAGGGSVMRRSTTRPIEISEPQQRMSNSSSRATRRSGSLETTADAWERARLAKVNKWYEKMNAKIREWEKEKKKRANLDMGRRKAELDRLKRLNLHHYQNKIDRIENVAEGARKQLEEKKRIEEASARAKANKIRSTGRPPVQCFCFEC